MTADVRDRRPRDLCCKLHFRLRIALVLSQHNQNACAEWDSLILHAPSLERQVGREIVMIGLREAAEIITLSTNDAAI